MDNRERRLSITTDFYNIMDLYEQHTENSLSDQLFFTEAANYDIGLKHFWNINGMDSNEYENNDYFPWSHDLKTTITGVKNFSNSNQSCETVNRKYDQGQNLSQNNIGSEQIERIRNTLQNGGKTMSSNAVGHSLQHNGTKLPQTILMQNEVDADVKNRFLRKRKTDCDSDDVKGKISIISKEHYESDLTSKDPLALDNCEQEVQEDVRHNGRLKKERSDDGQAPRISSWQVDDITDNLTADLDGSLSGLGADLSTGSYNMSEALLTLPTLQVFKQEAPSPPTSHEGPLLNSGVTANINTNSRNQHGQCQSPTSTTASHANGTINQQLHVQRNGAQADPNNNQNNGISGSLQNLLGTSYNNTAIPTIISAVSLSPQSQDHYNRSAVTSSDVAEDCRFQYVLAAATSIATKMNEDTLTYLNQGQSYEIKLKKLGDLSNCKGKTLKSVIGICFHERRMQYGERERLSQWQSGRPGDRVLEVDVPLSYGLTGLQQPTLNTVTFNWDPTVPVGVYIKVNCISTEFTPKKHGGEKGVPFRIQIETYMYEQNIGDGLIAGLGKRLHTAACQIKVFKLKGADRKHKQDREKIMKRPPSEQEKYQPSYDCTVLNDLSSESFYPCLNNTVAPNVSTAISLTSNQSTNFMNNTLVSANSFVKGEDPSLGNNGNLPCSPVNLLQETKGQIVNIQSQLCQSSGLSSDANSDQTAAWLQAQRFGAHIGTFASFSGADILRLSRDDLVQICGLADGIRLYNALHAKTIAPKLTLYMCLEQSTVFNAMYLSSYTNSEFCSKLSTLIGISSTQVQDFFVQGPNGIHVLISDDVIRNFKDETMFVIEVMHDIGKYRVLLKPVNQR